MLQEKQGPAAWRSPRPPGGDQNNVQSNDTRIRPPKKWRRVLAALLTGKSFNRFEMARAEALLGGEHHAGGQ